MNLLKNIASSLLDEQEKFTDLTQVAVVDADACLDVLKKRFDHGSIYTNCGPLLVAINPYCEVEGLYSNEVLEEHLTIMPTDTPQPHVYGMAARAYQKMMATGDNQAVVISGESGAGKTESAKFLLTYLAAAASGTSAETSDARGALQRAVMATNPIMESYGCAKTVRNDNSSRFGKLVLLKFTKTGRLEAASMQTYLLEKSRVPFQAANECNFHAFYEMLVGVPASDRVAIGLPPKSSGALSFAYLSTAASKERDAARDGSLFVRTREAMEAVGLDLAEQTGVMRLLVAILQLGNVSFGSSDEAKIDSAGTSAASKALVSAADLLGCEAVHLGTGMCSRRLKAGSDWVTTGNTVAQASEVRHALVKQLYSYLFLWLVQRINASLARTPTEIAEGAYGGGHGPHIAYVDIFGFEVFAVNSLEQLCINFANEKLQRLFVGVLFESVHAMYDSEGITVERVEYADNKRVVDLIGASPHGLLAMLTEECVFPKGSDTSYLQKVCNSFRRNENFIEVKTSSTDFGVRHFAGEVTYDVRGFLEKNKDPISQDLQVLIEFSEDPFVADLMKTAKEIVVEQQAAAAAAPADSEPSKMRAKGGASKMRSGKFVGVVDGFKSSLRKLIATLQSGELHFIRCLKPNDDKAPLSWDRSVSHRQLMSAGLVQAVAATREGYSDHLQPVHITQAFGPLVPDLDLSQTDINAMETAAHVLESCGVTEEMYALGKTKVFLRPGVLDELQRLRLEHIGAYATLMQSMIRGALARIMIRRVREAAFRKAEEKRRREEEIRRQREDAERRRQEALRLETEAKAKAEREEADRRKAVQKARALSFDRKRRKKVEEEDRKKREEEAAALARKASNDLKRAEAADRMRRQLAESGVGAPAPSAHDISDAADIEMRVARAEAEAAAASEFAELHIPDSPSPAASSSTGFMLKLPETPTPTSAKLFSPNGGTPGPLLEQRRLDDVSANFVCPLEDVIAFAEMIGMDVQEDLDLLWIADEALQAPEPVGWEQRMDPRGNVYYCNTLTTMTMVQHPVDYHYQQLYLQFKMQRQQQQQAALMTPRSRASFDASNAASKSRNSSYKLDLRSVNGDRADGEDAPQTPKGWIKRATSSLLTPRSSRAESANTCSASEYTCTELEVRVMRGGERLGMELNAYNQILSFQPGGPTDRHPDVKLYDRILGVDGTQLGSRMLTDILVPAEQHVFHLERWAPPLGVEASRALSPRTMLGLGKARAHGNSAEAAVIAAEKEHAARHKKRGKKGGDGGVSDAPVSSRFTVTLTRQEPGGGLGLVCDEDNVVVDMVPGSPADMQRLGETKSDPRLQLGDKIMTVDGVPVTSEAPLEVVIVPATSHCLSIERTLEPPKKEKEPASGSMSPRGLFKAMTPRSSKAEKEAEKKQPWAPTRALREVRIYKATEEERLGIRFVRDDEGFDCDAWGRGDNVTPIVAALDPKGEAARAGMEIDDMVLSINGQTGAHTPHTTSSFPPMPTAHAMPEASNHAHVLRSPPQGCRTRRRPRCCGTCLARLSWWCARRHGLAPWAAMARLPVERRRSRIHRRRRARPLADSCSSCMSGGAAA